MTPGSVESCQKGYLCRKEDGGLCDVSRDRHGSVRGDDQGGVGSRRNGLPNEETLEK